MNKIRSACLGPCLVVLAAASCGFPRLPELAAGGSDGGGAGDGETNDGGPPPLDLELLAGDIGGFGNADGAGATARFHFPFAAAIDGGGNVFVADAFNHTIRKITAAGVVTTLAGTAGSPGSADGTGAAARFNFPEGVAVDAAGNIYVADSGNSTIRKVTPAGVVTTLAGTAGSRGSVDGTGAAARFAAPDGLAVDSAGNVYVGDEGNNTIRKVTPAGVVTTLAGTAGTMGSADGTGAAARFTFPMGIAVDSADNIYVADSGNHTIRRITPAGGVTTLAGIAGVAGSADGTGGAASFRVPAGVAIDGTGNLYVADSNNHTIRKVTATRGVTTLAGAASRAGSTDGTIAAASFFSPGGVAVDDAGNINVADTFNHTIRMVATAGVVTTLAGTAGVIGSADDTGAAALFHSPNSVAVDSAGNVYVADTFNHAIRKVTPAGVVTTLAGTAGMMGIVDGTGAAARFTFPMGTAVDGANNVYVADSGNHTIRKVTPAGVVTTLAGTAGMAGSADGMGGAASFNFPVGIAVDGAGNAYVTDAHNFTIRKVTPDGVVTTLAGTAGMGAARMALGPPRVFAARPAWRSTPQATSTSPTRRTPSFARSLRPGRRRRSRGRRA